MQRYVIEKLGQPLSELIDQSPAAVGDVYIINVPKASQLHNVELVKKLVAIVVSQDNDDMELGQYYQSIFDQYALDMGSNNAKPKYYNDVYNEEQPKKKTKVDTDSDREEKPHWSDALNKYCLYPEEHPEQVVDYDDTVVVIRDLYPKVDDVGLTPGQASLLDNATGIDAFWSNWTNSETSPFTSAHEGHSNRSYSRVWT
jgi:hypothetical protein